MCDVVSTKRTGRRCVAGVAGPDDPAVRRAFAQAINRVAGDAELRTRFGLNGRARVVERFGWDAIAKRTVDLYRSLI